MIRPKEWLVLQRPEVAGQLPDLCDIYNNTMLSVRESAANICSNGCAQLLAVIAHFATRDQFGAVRDAAYRTLGQAVLSDALNSDGSGENLTDLELLIVSTIVGGLSDAKASVSMSCAEYIIRTRETYAYVFRCAFKLPSHSAAYWKKLLSLGATL